MLLVFCFVLVFCLCRCLCSSFSLCRCLWLIGFVLVLVGVCVECLTCSSCIGEGVCLAFVFLFL